MKKFVELNYPGFKYVSHKDCNDFIQLAIEPIYDYARCPDCGVISKSIHVFTKRSFLDIPFNNKMINVTTHTRVFKCKNKQCITSTFTEPLSFLNIDDKMSKRLVNRVLEVGYNNSNRKSVDILKEDQIIVSRGVIQRLVNKYKESETDDMVEVIELNKAKTTEGILNGDIKHLEAIYPSIANDILEVVEDRYDFISLIDEVFDDNTKHYDAKKPNVFIFASVSARLKQLAATSSVPLAITSIKLLEKLKLNLLNKNKDGTYFTEGWLRDHINEYKNADTIVKKFNDLLLGMADKLDEKPKMHILDCTKIPIYFSNSNYENAGIASDGDGNKIRGYKAGILRGCLKNGGIIEEAIIDSANIHDLELTKEMVIKSKHLKAKDIVLMDRGFIDLDFIRKLKSRGVDVIVPARNNMDIFTEAVSIAKENNIWVKHPTRQSQDIALVENLTNWGKESNVINFSSCVVRIEKEFNFEYTDKEYLSQDEKYIYIVILSTNTKIGAKKILELYSKRPEIEEDFRQLKDFWKMCDFKSTKYKFIVFYLMTVFSAYNYYQLFKNLEIGKAYRRVTLPIAIKKQRENYSANEVKIIIVSGRWFGIYEFYETYDLYDKFTDEVKKKFKLFLKGG